MVTYTYRDREYESLLAMLRVANELRGPCFNPPRMADTLWIQTRWPKSIYL